VTQPQLFARCRITNGTGTFDSGNPLTADRIRIQAAGTWTLEPTPNTIEIRLYNLEPETADLISGTVRKRIDWTPEERAQLIAAGASAAPIEVTTDNAGLASVELDWGYSVPGAAAIIPPLSLGFVGASNSIVTKPDGLDMVTTILAEDGGHTLGAASVVQVSGGGLVSFRSKSYSAGTNVVDIVVDLINAMALTVDRARLENTLATATIAGGGTAGDLLISGSYTCSGPAVDHLRSFLSAVDLRWSIQNGEFLLLDSSSVIPGFPALKLSEADGTLHGPVERLQAQEMAAETWANPLARPGRQVEIQGVNVGTQYRIDQADLELDTYEGGSTRLKLDALQTIEGVF
jgi:hypothetical protein